MIRNAGKLTTLVAAVMFVVTAAAAPPAQCSDETAVDRLAQGPVVAGDEVRGCCVYQTTPARCAAANKGFCRASAAEASVDYRFYPATKCKHVAACSQ